MEKVNNQYYRYMIFAIFAIFVNIIVQILSKEIFISFFNSISYNFIEINASKFEYWFIFALGSGTLAGFVFKFIVDKFIVFEDVKNNTIEKTTKQLTLYLTFAIFTTIIFWGFELLFKVLFSGDVYLIGGIIGLAIGYTVKFVLDRTYVFTIS